MYFEVNLLAVISLDRCDSETMFLFIKEKILYLDDYDTLKFKLTSADFKIIQKFTVSHVKML